MAALGGSRHEAESVSTKSDGRYTVKKSPSPATGTNGHEYVLYHASKLHSTSKFARLVYDLPGEFVVFCGLLYALKIISKNISKGGV